MSWRCNSRAANFTSGVAAGDRVLKHTAAGFNQAGVRFTNLFRRA
jgi:hypothetical protein